MEDARRCGHRHRRRGGRFRRSDPTERRDLQVRCGGSPKVRDVAEPRRRRTGVSPPGVGAGLAAAYPPIATFPLEVSMATENCTLRATENCTLREKGTDQIRAEIHGKRPSVSYRAGSSRAHVSASMRYALGSMLGASPVHHKHPDQYRHPEHGPLCGCGRPQSMVLGLGAAVSENLLDVRCLDASLERVAGDGPAKGGSIKPVLTIENRCCVCGEPGCIDPTALGREGMYPACRSHHDQATANLETRGGRRAPPVDPVRRAGR